MMEDKKHFQVERRNSAVVLHLKDPNLFDTLLINGLHDELLEFIELEKPQKLLVDFKRVTYSSTAVINALLRAKKRVGAEGGQLKLSSMAEPIREQFRILNLDGTVFDIYPSSEAALATFP